MEEEDFTEVMARIVMDFVRKKERREVAQQGVESVVARVGCFNEDEVPNFWRAYNAEIMKWGMCEATRLEYFFQVAVVSIDKEVKDL